MLTGILLGTRPCKRCVHLKRDCAYDLNNVQNARSRKRALSSASTLGETHEQDDPKRGKTTRTSATPSVPLHNQTPPFPPEYQAQDAQLDHNMPASLHYADHGATPTESSFHDTSQIVFPRTHPGSQNVSSNEPPILEVTSAYSENYGNGQEMDFGLDGMGALFGQGSSATMPPLFETHYLDQDYLSALVGQGSSLSMSETADHGLGLETDVNMFWSDFASPNTFEPAPISTSPASIMRISPAASTSAVDSSDQSNSDYAPGSAPNDHQPRPILIHSVGVATRHQSPELQSDDEMATVLDQWPMAWKPELKDNDVELDPIQDVPPGQFQCTACCRQISGLTVLQ